MSDQNEKPEFRVVDKRRFSSEGESLEPSSRERADAPASAARPSERPAPQGAAGEKQKMEFSSLLVSLATQALVLLGEIPNAELEGGSVNLDAAKQTIDILGLLEEKTVGNLTADEQKLLTEILASLRLAYVKKLEK